jgi:hypothetical protein
MSSGGGSRPAGAAPFSPREVTLANFAEQPYASGQVGSGRNYPSPARMVGGVLLILFTMSKIGPTKGVPSAMRTI